jgi:hypothetical protein
MYRAVDLIGQLRNQQNRTVERPDCSREGRRAEGTFRWEVVIQRIFQNSLGAAAIKDPSHARSGPYPSTEDFATEEESHHWN